MRRSWRSSNGAGNSNQGVTYRPTQRALILPLFEDTAHFGIYAPVAQFRHFFDSLSPSRVHFVSVKTKWI